MFYEFNSQNSQNILYLFEFKDQFYFIGQLDQTIGFEVYKFDQINSGIRQTWKNTT